MIHRLLALAATTAALTLVACERAPVQTVAGPAPATPAANAPDATAPEATPGATEATDVAPVANTVVMRFAVGGMTCGGCVASVNEAIASVEGVSECEVSLEEGSAVVHADSEERAEAILEAVKNKHFVIARAPEGPDETESEEG